MDLREGRRRGRPAVQGITFGRPLPRDADLELHRGRRQRHVQHACCLPAGKHQKLRGHEIGLEASLRSAPPLKGALNADLPFGKQFEVAPMRIASGRDAPRLRKGEARGVEP